jgi:2-oxoglutarate dehydrogenase E2 component (dihydrolipoamide succinyltransferase)
MTPMRQRIASRLVEAQHTAAMLTTFNEVDMGAVMALRKQFKEDFEKKHGIGLGFMSFFVKAAARPSEVPAGQRVHRDRGGRGQPADREARLRATSPSRSPGPKGLVVPVLRNCESMSFADVESGIKDFATRAKDGKLELSEMRAAPSPSPTAASSAA